MPFSLGRKADLVDKSILAIGASSRQYCWPLTLKRTKIGYSEMKVSRDCYQCLQKLVYQTARLATTDEEIRAAAIRRGMKVLKEGFSPHRVPADLGSEVQRAIREVSGNEDPYKGVKGEEIMMARKIYDQVKSNYLPDFYSDLRLSALGNAIDFFRTLAEVGQDANRGVEFAIDDTSKVLNILQTGKVAKVLYLADNAGEIFFDLPLITEIEKFSQVIYVVKGSPIQNDITREDLHRAKVEIKNVITTGSDSVGIDFCLASDEFKREFEQANLVLAKGMGHYETLSEISICGKIFFIFMAKCKPVANSLDVPLGSYVAMLP